MSSLETKVKAFSDREGLFDCDIILVALSAGPDSAALLDILCELKPAAICAVHINHNLRPGDCLKDEQLARSMCEKQNVEFFSYSYDIAKISREQKTSEEETGRKVRYETFMKCASELESRYEGKTVRIAVAHHRDDVAETMMMNLFRGSGLEGLVAPKALSGRIIRPLLCADKEEILEYLRERGIEYAEDATNAQSEYTRNFWRNEIIPLIGTKSVKDPVQALNDTYALLKDDADLISSMVDESYNPAYIVNKPMLAVEEIRTLHPSIASRVIRRLWEEIFGDTVDLGTVHVRAAEELMKAVPDGTHTADMPFSRIAFRTGDLFGFCSKEELPEVMDAIASSKGVIVLRSGSEYDIAALTGKNTAILPESGIQIKSEIIENISAMEYNILSWLFPLEDGESIEGFKIMNGVGDLVFAKAGASGSKKLRRVLADLKIPREARDKVAAVVKDGRLLWVPGVGHAEGFVSEASYEAWKKAYTGKQLPARYLKITLS